MEASKITQGKKRQVLIDMSSDKLCTKVMKMALLQSLHSTQLHVISSVLVICHVFKLILQFGKMNSIIRNVIFFSPSPFFLKFSSFPFMAGVFSLCFCDRMNSYAL